MNALELRGLEKSFGGLRVIANVSLSVEPGERRLIIGPNGAGKTTLFNLITGELPVDAGSVRLFEHDITGVPSRRRAHLGLARTYQIITLFPGETLLRNVTLSLLGLSRLRWNPLVRLDRQSALLAASAKVRVLCASLVAQKHGKQLGFLRVRESSVAMPRLNVAHAFSKDVRFSRVLRMSRDQIDHAFQTMKLGYDLHRSTLPE